MSNGRSEPLWWLGSASAYYIIGWRIVNGRQSSKFTKELVHLFQLLLRLPSGIWAVCRNATAKIPFPCHWGRQFPPTNVEMATRPNLGEFSLLSLSQNKYHIDIHWDMILLSLQGYAKLVIIVCILAHFNPFVYFGVNATPSIFQWALDNKFYACMMLFFVSNAVESQVGNK